MFRLALFIGIAVALAVAAVAAAAACTGEQEPPDPFEGIDCDPGQPECAELINERIRASLPTPPPAEVKAEVLEILFSNEVIKMMLAGRELGRDYWFSMSYFEDPRRGDRGAMFVIALAEPTSYEGEVPTASDPCNGHYGGNEGVPEGDPCLDEPWGYGTTYAAYVGVNTIHARVEMGRGEVVEIGAGTTPPDDLADMIAYFKRTQGQ